MPPSDPLGSAPLSSKTGHRAVIASPPAKQSWELNVLRLAIFCDRLRFPWGERVLEESGGGEREAKNGKLVRLAGCTVTCHPAKRSIQPRMPGNHAHAGVYSTWTSERKERLRGAESLNYQWKNGSRVAEQRFQNNLQVGETSFRVVKEGHSGGEKNISARGIPHGSPAG
ncbi:hypothetical protein MRX96_012180 [Rhipicephalus microplus]